MKITSKLKSKEELVGLLDINLMWVDKAISKCELNLYWDKSRGGIVDSEYAYDIDWLSTLTFAHDKFQFALDIDGLDVTVKTMRVDEDVDSMSLKFKDKFTLEVDKLFDTDIDEALWIGFNTAETTHTFKSIKARDKFIGRLCRVKEIEA